MYKGFSFKYKTRTAEDQSSEKYKNISLNNYNVTLNTLLTHLYFMCVNIHIQFRGIWNRDINEYVPNRPGCLIIRQIF